jgi:AsmA family protein
MGSCCQAPAALDAGGKCNAGTACKRAKASGMGPFLMLNYFKAHKITAAITLALSAVVLFLALLVLVLNSNLLRPTLAHLISSKTGRDTKITGNLHTKLLSWTPTLEIGGITIKNPPWADKPVMFSADEVRVSLRLGRLLRGQIVLPQVALKKPIINLERDKEGRASWELGTKVGTPNGNTKPAKIPTILSLTIEDGSLNVVDQIRKLRFEGSLVAAEQGTKNDPSAFKIRAKGSLNDKPFSLDVDGAPLKDLTPKTAYTFTAKVTAADINLDTKVTVEKPFDLSKLDVDFVVSGKDLADGFYLTGLALPNTPPYRLAASVKVSGTTFSVHDLNGRLGSSDLTGQVVVETKSKIPKMTAVLVSKTLNLVDLAPTLGVPAVNKGDSLAASADSNSKDTAVRQKSAPAKVLVTAYQKANDRVFPDSELQVNRVRGMDADVHYSAGAVNTPKLPIRQVAMHIMLEKGVLSIDPLSFVLDQGKFTGSVRIDARNKVPESAIDMRIENVDLSQFKSATMKSAPLTGSLMGRMQLKGSGDSLHKFASSAQGALSIIIPKGEINAGIAELTGIDVTRGLGLLVGKNEQKTEIRCSVMDFQAQEGELAEKTFFIDTTDVLISGSGDINLRDEKLKLELKGDPKRIRFTRLRSPITLGGTLAHPAIGVDVKKLAAQAGVATALGTLLTPVAAVIAFIDPGLAKNKDCSAALEQTSEPVPAAGAANPK